MPAAVELSKIVKSYDGKTTVIHGIDLDIRAGEFVVFVGPSGCGKSTLLRMIAGLEPISGGEARIDGQVVNDLPPRHRDIAMVFQDYALYPHKTLFDNMAFGLRLRKTPEAEVQRRVMDAARLLKIDHMLERRPAALSGGQRQRVAIGRAIVRQPKVFLFDEPLSNLDAQLRGEMRSEIKRLHQRLGATIIYVTHDQVEAMTLADRIAVLSAGHKMQYDTPEAIYNRPAALFVAGFTGAPPMNLVDCTRAEGGVVDLGGERVPLAPALAAAMNGASAPQALKFGVRPENIALASPGNHAAALPAEVVLLEPLGAETLVTFKIGAAELVARCPAGFRERPGTRLSVHVQAEHMHLFDAASGQALRGAL
jgi:multiple sugar transport system ATP-binding protein